MLSKANGIYTTAQVESQIRAELGAQEFRWRLELRDKEGNIINSDLKGLVDGSLDWVRNRRIRGGGQFMFRKQDVSLDAYATQVLASSPLFYWRLGEASGTIADDASPNNRDGTYVNTPTLNVGSLLKGDKANGAVMLNGTDEYISIADNAAFDVANLSVEFWAKFTSSAQVRIVSRDDVSNLSWNVAFSTTLKFRIYIATVLTELDSGVIINDGIAHHVVCSYDGAYMRIFVDGVQVAKKAQTGNIDSVASQIFVSSFRGASNFFNGTIDEVAFYGAALPAKVIREHYQKGASQLQAINFNGGDRIRVFLRLKMEDGGFAEYPRGEYLLGYPVTRETETGTRYEVLAFDKVKLLDDYKFSDRYVIASGTLYTTAISNLLALVYQSGEYSVSTTSTKTLAATMSFQVGENLLDAVNKLATAINYGNAFSDANGNVILEEYVEPASRAVDDTWNVDNGQSFISWDRELSSNYNETFNWVIAKSVSPKNGTISRAIAKNHNASHPTNIANVGQRTFVYEVQAADSGTLQSIADRKLIEVSAPVEKFRTESVFLPFYENEEKIRKIEDDEYVDYFFEERHTPLNGKPPFIESYILNKVYNL